MLAFNDAKSDLSFLIGINKPTGMTSHDVVNACRKILGIKRIGHMGTLDPLASGVMLIGVGSAARLNNYLEAADKTYKVTAEFGKATDTYDAEGLATSQCEVAPNLMTKEFATEYLSKLVGKHIQKPPAYSAIKVDGKPAYKSARKGDEVNLPEREIEIYETSLCEVSQNS